MTNKQFKELTGEDARDMFGADAPAMLRRGNGGPAIEQDCMLCNKTYFAAAINEICPACKRIQKTISPINQRS